MKVNSIFLSQAGLAPVPFVGPSVSLRSDSAYRPHYLAEDEIIVLAVCKGGRVKKPQCFKRRERD